MNLTIISAREKEVLHLIPSEVSAKQIIGHRLFFPNTVFSDCKSLLSKSTLSNIRGFVRKALRMKLIYTSVILFMSTAVFSQSEIELRTDGIVVPRVDSSGVAGPLMGQVIFDTTSHQLLYFDDYHWRPVGQWALSGDDIFYDNANVGIGLDSPSQRLEIVGNLALPITSESAGDSSGLILSEGKRYIHNFGVNSFFAGVNAGNLDFYGTANTGVGCNALISLTTGYANAALGNFALSSNTEGFDNSAVGSRALTNNVTGVMNTGVGSGVMFNNYTASGNTAIGFEAMSRFPQPGDGNVAVGRLTLSGNESGTDNIAIGDSADVGRTHLTNAIAIGANAVVSASNSLVLGGIGTNSVKVGIGVDSPSTVLTLLAPGATGPVGITQNQVGGGSSMELTTQDNSGGQATRLLMQGVDLADIEFYTGARGAEQLTMMIEGSNGRLAIDNKAPTQKLDVNGNGRFRSVGSGIFSNNLNITANGTLTTSTSDRRLKKNIYTLENALEKITGLRGVSFNWKDDPGEVKRIGLIAQEVEEVVPEIVFTNPVDDYKGVRYQEITALLIEAVKELEAKNVHLSQLINEQAVLIRRLQDVQGH